MNLNHNPTSDQLRELLRPCDDTAGDHALWVSKAGQVVIERLPRGQSAAELLRARPELQMRVDTFLAGNEYVGPDAAADDEWVAALFDRLLQEWPKAVGKPEPSYAGSF